MWDRETSAQRPLFLFQARTRSTIFAHNSHSRPSFIRPDCPSPLQRRIQATTMKYVLVSGGVISGIGKGVIASSTGLLLKTLGLRVTAIKIDPYMNIDAGTMSPLEHGEVFVLDDGGEVDLDLGNYERYLGVTLTRDNNITTGKIYSQVIEREVCSLSISTCRGA